jgi:hypothetical protein
MLLTAENDLRPCYSHLALKIRNVQNKNVPALAHRHSTELEVSNQTNQNLKKSKKKKTRYSQHRCPQETAITHHKEPSNLKIKTLCCVESRGRRSQ